MFTLTEEGATRHVEMTERWLARRVSDWVVTWALFSLAADRPGEERGLDGTLIKTPRISDEEVATTTRFTVNQIRQLRAKMNQVRARRLKHLAFRACFVGSLSDTLQAFLNVFGAASIVTPKEVDAYGEFNPGTVDD